MTMHDKKHILCHICQEPQCLGKECLFLADRREITRSIQKISPGNQTLVRSDKTALPVSKTFNPVHTEISPVRKTLSRVMQNFINFNYLPSFFRRNTKFKPLPVKQDKKYIACYICDEAQCLGLECIFRSDPDDLTGGMKNFIHYKYIPFSSGKPKSVSFKNLQIHAVKLFWFTVVLVTIIYVLVVGGLHLVSTTLSIVQSQVPLQFYIAAYAVMVTIVCLALANLFGSDSENT